jgi:transposase InsO family protein
MAQRYLGSSAVLDALEQAIWQRKTHDNRQLVHHSDRGSHYLSIKYTERLEQAGQAEIDLSVASVGDAYDNALYDNALAQTIIGLFKTEVIKQNGPWKSMRQVEWARSNGKHSNGSTGTTTAACSAQSVTQHQPKRSKPSMQT